MGRRDRVILGGWLLLLVASHLWLAWQGEDEEVGGGSGVVLPSGWLAYQEWGERDGVPVILSHGSPGSGGDFDRFASTLAAEGRWVIAPDRWGFGRSEKKVADYSFVADAEAMVGLMDALGVAKADVMGWSYGGGVVLEVASRYPERVRSVGLLGAIGIVEGEGSGSYVVEHAKYGLLWGAVVALPEMVPHFGTVGPRWFRRSFVRDFWDADQRPLRGLLEELEQPTLILHGKDDPLVPAWVAEEHHQIVAQSRLTILRGSHFFPMGAEGMEAAAREVEEFLQKVTAREPVSLTRYETPRKKMRALWEGGPELRGWRPWGLVMLVRGLIAWRHPRIASLLVGVGGGLLLWDGGVGFLAVLVVVAARRIISKVMQRRGKDEPQFSVGRWEWAFALGLFITGTVVGGILMRMA